jgi:hypothetical protein
MILKVGSDVDRKKFGWALGIVICILLLSVIIASRCRVVESRYETIEFKYDVRTFGSQYLDDRLRSLESKGWYVVSMPRILNNCNYFTIKLRRDKVQEVIVDEKSSKSIFSRTSNDSSSQ